MAKYRVLRSAAHNYGASFISVMNMAPDDYAMCYLLRAAQRTAIDELRVNLLTGVAEPTSLLSPELAQAVAGYCEGFGAHIQRSEAAFDMVSSAELRVHVVWGRVVGQRGEDGVMNAKLLCTVSIVDDRGVRHDGEVSEAWVCHATRRFY